MEIITLLNFILLAFVGFYASLPRTNAAGVAKTPQTFRQLCMDEYTAKLVHYRSLRAGGKEVEELFKKYRDLWDHRVELGFKVRIYFCPPKLIKDKVDQLRKMGDPSVQPAHFKINDAASASEHFAKDSIQTKVSKETFEQFCIDEYKAKLVYYKSSPADDEIGELFKKYMGLMEHRMVLGSKLGIRFCPPKLVKDAIHQVRKIADPSSQSAGSELGDAAAVARKHNKEKDSFKSKVSNLFGCFSGSQQSCSD